MNKTSLYKTTKSSKKRVGRGYGSGKGGHTSGRGQKGQKSRSKVNVLFEGVKVKKSLIKRLPLQRGKGKFAAAKKPMVLNLSYLNILPSGTVVDFNLLVKKGFVKKSDAESFGIKILGDGKLEKKLVIKDLSISKSAVKKVEKAGGKVINGENGFEKTPLKKEIKTKKK